MVGIITDCLLVSKISIIVTCWCLHAPVTRLTFYACHSNSGACLFQSTWRWKVHIRFWSLFSSWENIRQHFQMEIEFQLLGVLIFSVFQCFKHPPLPSHQMYCTHQKKKNTRYILTTTWLYIKIQVLNSSAFAPYTCSLLLASVTYVDLISCLLSK